MIIANITFLPKFLLLMRVILSKTEGVQAGLDKNHTHTPGKK
jgi:hypothetical protein